MGYLIKNVNALRNGKLAKCSLLIRKDRIKSFSFYSVRSRSDDTVINADGLFLMPGVIDPHVHLREPGFTQKEDLFTGSQAAVAGGITTVFDMPNTNPPTFTLRELQQKRRLAKPMLCNHAFYAGARPGNESEIRKMKNVPATKIYMDVTTGEHLVTDKHDLLKLFRASKMVAVHAEGMQVKRAIELAQTARKKLYCCHVSTSKELSQIAAAKRKGRKVYCEVTPHHLFLSHSDDKSGFTKMKPPLRSKDNVNALWQGIEAGLVDTVGTDHAPHTAKEKRGMNPPFGVPGLETSLPLMLTAAKEGRLSLSKVLELMCTNPAKIFRVRGRGKLKRAFFADLTLVDMDTVKKVDGSQLKTKCKWSPFEGRELYGWPKYTFVNGNLVYENGTIHKVPAREVLFR